MANKDFAIENIMNGKIKEGFSELAEVFAADGSDEELIEKLREVFLEPNLEQTHQNFLKNTKSIKEYPYIFEKLFVESEQNRYVLFPLDENLYYCYDKQEKKLFPMEVNSDRETKYFFKDLHKPLFIENEFNEFNLKFLNDNVRDSCDFAGDNHIYLWYENADLFSLLLYYCDLNALLEHKKFVFLIGDERDKYPIDFKSEFSIDYSSMTPQKIRIEEMKRFCFWYKHAHSGTVFSLGVLGTESCIQAMIGHDFHAYSTVDGKPLYFDEEFRKIMSDPQYEFLYENLLEITKSKKFHIAVDDLKDYLHWIKTNHATAKGYTVKELFCGYFLFHYEKAQVESACCSNAGL